MRSRSWCGFTRDKRRSGSGDRPARGRSLAARAGLALVLFSPMFAGGLDAATGSKIVADGRIESTVGGFRFPDGTVQATAAETAAYEGVVIVAKSGGDYTSIQAALDGLSPVPSLTNKYLIWVAPGIYEEQVTMRAYVDIVGAGQGITKITQPGLGTGTGTVVGADVATLRSLTVESIGGENAVAVYANGTSPTLRDVTVRASTAAIGCYGVYATGGGARPVLQRVKINAGYAGTRNYGIYSATSARPEISDVTAYANDGLYAYGMYFLGAAGLEIHDSSATAESGSESSYGLYLGTATDAEIVHSRLTGIGDVGTTVAAVRHFAATADYSHTVFRGVRTGVGEDLSAMRNRNADVTCHQCDLRGDISVDDTATNTTILYIAGSVLGTPVYCTDTTATSKVWLMHSVVTQALPQALIDPDCDTRVCIGNTRSDAFFPNGCDSP